MKKYFTEAIEIYRSMVDESSLTKEERSIVYDALDNYDIDYAPKNPLAAAIRMTDVAGNFVERARKSGDHILIDSSKTKLDKIFKIELLIKQATSEYRN